MSVSESKLMTRNLIDNSCTHFLLHFRTTISNPTPEDSDSDLPKWLPTTGFPLDYYRFGTKDFEGQPPLAMERGLFEERSAFWNKYLPHLAAVSNVEKGEL